MESLSSKNKIFNYLLCVIDICTKYPWVKLLKDKKCKAVLNAITERVNESSLKPNKLRLIKKENFTIDLSKNGSTIMIF